MKVERKANKADWATLPVGTFFLFCDILHLKVGPYKSMSFIDGEKLATVVDAQFSLVYPVDVEISIG